MVFDVQRRFLDDIFRRGRRVCPENGTPTAVAGRAQLSRLLRRNLPRLSVMAYAEVPADKIVQVNTELSIGEGT